MILCTTLAVWPPSLERHWKKSHKEHIRPIPLTHHDAPRLAITNIFIKKRNFKARSPETGPKELDSVSVMWLYQFHLKKKTHYLFVLIMRLFPQVKLAYKTLRAHFEYSCPRTWNVQRTALSFNGSKLIYEKCQFLQVKRLHITYALKFNGSKLMSMQMPLCNLIYEASI